MGVISAILRRPSQRTQYEATLTGLSVLIITSLITPIYIIFFTDFSILFKILSAFSGIAIVLILFSNLSMTYLQYYFFKKSMGLYNEQQEIGFLIEDAQEISRKLDSKIKLMEKYNV